MKKFLLAIVALVAFGFYTARAQNTGFGGKRVVIKTEVLHGSRALASGLAAEFVINRSLTASAGYRRFSANYNQKYFEGDYVREVRSSYCNNSWHGKEMSDKALVSTRMLNLELRKYFKRRGSTPAPNGLFAYGNYAWGNADVEGQYYKSLTTNLSSGGNYSSNCIPDEVFSYRAEKVKVQAFETGFGYQGFLTHWLTLEIKGGLNLTRLNYNRMYDSHILAGVAKSYGPNLMRANLFGDISDTPTTKSLGLSTNIQFGIMLF